MVCVSVLVVWVVNSSNRPKQIVSEKNIHLNTTEKSEDAKALALKRKAAEAIEGSEMPPDMDGDFDNARNELKNADAASQPSSTNPVLFTLDQTSGNQPVTGNTASPNDAKSSNTSAQVMDALRDLEQMNSQKPSTLMGGIRVRGGAGEDPTTPEERKKEQTSIALIDGQPRGFVLLPLMQPQARPCIEKQVDTLLKSQLRHLYITTLVDGTFSKDFDYLSEVIRRLSTEGRTLLLELYLSSGPTMRRFETTPIITPFSRINPILFRGIIQSDPTSQNAFKQIAASTKEVLMLNHSLNPANKNIICVMLEDNLNMQSYKKMRELVSGVLGDLADFVRNPCPGCVDGNDVDSAGDGIEVHAPEGLNSLTSNDGVTLDGTGYCYPGESSSGCRISYDTMLGTLKLDALKRLRYFGLWRQDRQSNGNLDIPPANRSYQVPTDDQAQFDIQLLQAGLVPG